MKNIAKIFLKNGTKIKINGIDCSSSVKEGLQVITMDGNSNVFLNGNSISLKSQDIRIEVNGDCGDIEAAGSVTVSGNISGNVDAGGSLTVSGNISGNVDAGGSVHCW